MLTAGLCQRHTSRGTSRVLQWKLGQQLRGLISTVLPVTDGEAPQAVLL
jgi:hypothetical protein